jgi:alpha-1,6-mannosyltransferase
MPAAATPASPGRPSRLIVLGGSGAAVMAGTTWQVAALPVHASVLSTPARVPLYVLFYLGLAAVLGAWLLLGRGLLRGGRPTPAVLYAFVAACAVPLLASAPFGRDLWAYAAQGHLVRHGLDPYTHGPSATPGPFTAEVSGRWIDSASPYGPLWLRLSQFGAWASGGHPTVAALLLRVPAVLGLLAAVWSVRVLATRLGGRLAAGLWLGLASPLTTVLGVGGGHNDLLMLGLALAGVAIASRPGLPALAAGAAVAALAIMVKSPAAIAVAFTVPVWLRANGHPITVPRVVRSCLVAVVAAAVAVGAVTAATGLGFGWTKQVNADAQWVSWLSLPSAIAMLAKAVSGSGDVKSVDDTLRACRTAGEVLTVVIVVVAWLLALRTARRAAVLGWFAAALGAAAVLAPSVQPWYYAWGLAVAGLVRLPRVALVALAAVALVFPVMITPSGYGYESSWPALPMLAGAVGLAWWALRSPPHDHDADHAGPEVRTDDSAEFGHV